MSQNLYISPFNLNLVKFFCGRKEKKHVSLLFFKEIFQNIYAKSSLKKNEKILQSQLNDWKSEKLPTGEKVR
jgi:hypothetical protein